MQQKVLFSFIFKNIILRIMMAGTIFVHMPPVYQQTRTFLVGTVKPH